jgi:hypothetical protein
MEPMYKVPKVHKQWKVFLPSGLGSIVKVLSNDEGSIQLKTMNQLFLLEWQLVD